MKSPVDLANIIRARGLWPLLEKAAKDWNVLATAMLSKSRTPILVRARDQFAYEVRSTFKGWSYPELARVIGYDHHTTALEAVRRHARLFGLEVPKS